MEEKEEALGLLVLGDMTGVGMRLGGMAVVAAPPPVSSLVVVVVVIGDRLIVVGVVGGSGAPFPVGAGFVVLLVVGLLLPLLPLTLLLTVNMVERSGS